MIKLGISGAEVELPEINWMAGSDYELPIKIRKSVERIEVMNGSARFRIREVLARWWELGWDYLDESELAILKGVVELNEVLRFQLNRDDNEWRDVVVTEFNYSSVESSRALGVPRYRASMVLEEVTT